MSVHKTNTRHKKSSPSPPHTQPLHQVPQHPHPPYPHPRIRPTTTLHITPIHPLQTPKHQLHTIPLPQRPTVRLQTPQRPPTRRIPNPLTPTRLHPHHRQPPHLLYTRQHPPPIPVQLVPHPQRPRTHYPTAIPPQPLRPQPTLVRIRPTPRRPHHPTRTPRQYTNTTAFRCERIRRSSAPRRNGASNGVLNPIPVPSTNTADTGNGVSEVSRTMPCAARCKGARPCTPSAARASVRR